MVDKDFCTETKVVGVTKCNDSGVLIQSLLPSLKEGDRLILIRDCDNQYDENAIKVYVSIEGRPQHIGYISASLAKNISPFLEENPKYDIEGVVRCITGGTDGKSYGCNITIWIQDPDEPSFEELHAFAKNFTTKKEKTNEEQYREKQEILEREFRTKIYKLVKFILIFTIVAFVLVYVVMSIIMYFEKDIATDTVNGGQSIPQTSQESENDVDESLSSEKISSDISSTIDNYWSEAPKSSASVSSSVSSKPKEESSQNNSSKITSSSIFSASENEVLVKVTEIDLKTSVLPPNSIGTVWMEATYTNNSNYAITDLTFKYLCKDTNETHYLSMSDTVLPGETSPKVDAFGPESGKESDIELLTCRMIVIDNNEEMFINYDYKLDSYELY